MRGSGRFEVAEVETDEGHGPGRSARPACVTRPDVLMCVDVALEAVPGEEGEKVVQIGHVFLVVFARTAVLESFPRHDEADKGQAPVTQS